MPILTLTTDIGQRDFLVGAIKGQFLTLDTAYSIQDITHYLPQANYLHAAYICKNAAHHFPQNSFHLILLNLYETTPTHLLMARFKGHYFVCPDNGILTMIAGQVPKEMVSIPVQKGGRLLDITEAAAKAITAVAHTDDLSVAGEAPAGITEKYVLRPTVGPDWMEGQVLFIDNFENVVINITREEFEEHRKGRSFKIVFTRNEVIDTLSEHYAAVAENEKMAWFNSAGYLEIAVNRGNMAGLFGLQGYNEASQQLPTNQQNKWFYQTVRVYFE